MAMKCASCKCINLHDRELLLSQLNKIILPDILYIVKQYIKSAPLKQLHSGCGGNPAHYICEECVSQMHEWLLMCDTPLITCPACSRELYMG
jgi:hypothetical protein